MVKVVKAKNANCWVSARMHTRERKRISQVLNTLPHPHNNSLLKHPVMKGNRSKEKGTQTFQPGKPHLNKLLLIKTSNLLAPKVFPELS